MPKKKKIKEVKANKEAVIVTQDAAKTEQKEKSILKPFAFFAVFVICIGGAVLYPYMTQEPHLPSPVSSHSTLKEDMKPVHIQKTEGIPALSDDIMIGIKDCTTKDETIVLQEKSIEELNEKIHQLEIENLNLKEQTNSSERLLPLTVQLIEEINSGEAFGTTLKSLLMQDKSNPFALAIEEHLGAYATTGIPTAENLKKQFYTQMKMAMDSLYATPTNASWNQKSANFFKSLVHIYPLEINPDKADAEELLFLAKQQVEAQDFKKAILSIEKLPPLSKQFLAGFVQDAQHYIEAKQFIKAYLNNERK